ncbi:MAG TPA: uracil-DNA glycosylase family protein [Ohtaekwangia sp.]|nr:uracil-DNA glycosylase family protein [Ohtaekwangia sp.]
MLADKILSFYKTIKLDIPLPDGVEVMNPYVDKTAFALCSAFYKKYYANNGCRRMILGINPGRFGAGVTGVPFTDPVKLEQCGIPNALKKKTELSADFIYTMIDQYGGPGKFYNDYYISALSPLGFTKDGKNLNYYDIKELQRAVEPFMIKCIRTQLDFGMDRYIGFCLGEGENFKYLQRLNQQHKFFGRIEPLAHPRFIMQYRRKFLNEYIIRYLEKLAIGE